MKEKNNLLKKKLLFSFVLFFLVVSFVTRKPGADENNIQAPSIVNNNISDSFLLGAMNNGLDTSYKLISDSLGLNVWHSYAGSAMRNNGSFETRGWDWWNMPYCTDSLGAPLNIYQSIVTNRLNSNDSRNIKTMMHRPKIEYLCFGQRSDYQCEATNTNPDLWFYTFNISKDTSYIDDIFDSTLYGNGVKVKYCDADTNNPALRAATIVKGLKANNEQVHVKDNGPSADVIHDWYIKPRIRIDSNFAHSNPNSKICRINIFNYGGDIDTNNRIKSIDILAKHFIDNSGNYNGKYLEEYFFAPLQPPTAIKIPRAKPFDATGQPNDSNAFNPDGEDWGTASYNCKVDFQVYWYGECDMWIDYIRVDDDIANRLLTGNDEQFNDWLSWESQLARHNDSPLKFYLELSEFNNVPCMSYVSKKLKDSTAGKVVNMMTDFTWNPFYSLRPYPPGATLMSAEYIKRNYIDPIGMTQFYAESYPLTGSDR